MSSTTQLAETPVESLRNQNDGDVEIDVWADYHEVHEWLLPFEIRRNNPIEMGNEIGEMLDELHSQAATVTRSDMNMTHGKESTIKNLFRSHGIIPLDRSNKRKRYRNPRYELYDEWMTPITDSEKQIAFFDRNISLGTVRIQWISKHLDMNQQELNQFSTNYFDNTPSELRRESTTRLGKTAITILEWTTHSQADIARAVDIPPSTLHDYIERAESEDWRPPRCPDDESWLSIN